MIKFLLKITAFDAIFLMKIKFNLISFKFLLVKLNLY